MLVSQRIDVVFIKQMANNEYWYVLMTEEEVNEYGLKSARLSCGDLITENSLVANLSMNYKHG